MKVTITDVGLPIAVLPEGVGLNIGFEYNGKHASAFMKLGEELKSVLYNAVKKEEKRRRAMAEVEELAEKIKALIGQEIEIP